jgi:hypothetical protein
MPTVAELEPEVEQQEVQAEASPEVPPAPPADCPPHLREHYDAILAREREVRTLEDDYLSLKEQASEAKKSFEAADKALRNLISRGSDPQRELPFDAPPPAPEAWRTAAFSELGLTAKQNELFESSGVTTIGGIEDLRAQIAEGKAEWPKGIGTAKVTDIENRIVSWLDKNRDKFGEAIPIDPVHSDGGLESITFSSPGRESVTLTAKHRDFVEEVGGEFAKMGILAGNGTSKKKRK